jgi:hypothetical protein
MKRYLMFAYPAYYPGGGWCDFQKSFDNLQEAFDFADSFTGESSGGIEIIDLETEADIYVYPKDREGYFA